MRRLHFSEGFDCCIGLIRLVLGGWFDSERLGRSSRETVDESKPLWHGKRYSTISHHSHHPMTCNRITTGCSSSEVRVCDWNPGWIDEHPTKSWWQFRNLKKTNSGTESPEMSCCCVMNFFWILGFVIQKPNMVRRWFRLDFPISATPPSNQRGANSSTSLRRLSAMKKVAGGVEVMRDFG